MAKLLQWYCRRGTFSLFLCWIAGAVLYALPSTNREQVRQTVRDAATPGSRAILEAQDHAVVHLSTLQTWLGARLATMPTAAIETPTGSHLLQVRQLELQIAQLHEQLAAAESGTLSTAQTAFASPLFLPQRLPARVIGRERNEARQSIDRLIDAGRRQGIADGDFVTDAALLETSFGQEEATAGMSMLLDQGSNTGVQVDQPVSAGRIVVGRVRQVGQWSSTVQLVHDVDFRASARLVRQSAQGPVLGAHGLFRGGGSPTTCQLTLVAATEPVAVGDAVYTSETVGGNDVQMLLGTVVRAELVEGSPEWRIDVVPALTAPPTKVDVLRLELNPERVAARTPDAAAPLPHPSSDVEP